VKKESGEEEEKLEDVNNFKISVKKLLKNNFGNFRSFFQGLNYKLILSINSFKKNYIFTSINCKKFQGFSLFKKII
jgi:hypothetical protein